MKYSFVLFSLCLISGISATSDPATGHYLGKKPSESWISTVSAKHNSDIQEAECSHNTRLSNQKFAWFQVDPSKINQNNSTYGSCFATTEVPPDSEIEDDSGYDVFYWQNTGGQPGYGTGPIRDPNTGEPGYEDDSGVFHTGKDPKSGKTSSAQGGSHKHGKTKGTGSGGSGTGTNSGDSSTGATSRDNSSGDSNTGTSSGDSGTTSDDNATTGGSSHRAHKGHKHPHTGTSSDDSGNTGGSRHGHKGHKHSSHDDTHSHDSGNRKRFYL